MQLPLDNGILFVHTPKTAGTSFRTALEQSVGRNNMYYDYGAVSPLTSDCVRRCTFEQKDILPLAADLRAHRGPFALAGHFPVQRYAAFFPAERIIAFMRDPVQHFVSTYEHFCRTEGLKSSLEAFCAESKPGHRQAHFFGDYPLSVIGCLGLQSHYAESLAMIQAQTGLVLPELVLNANEQQQRQDYVLEDALLQKIKRIVERDLKLYQEASALFHYRWQVMQQCKVFTHGKVNALGKQRLSGWAFRSGSQEAVTLLVRKNGVDVDRFRATVHRGLLREKNTPRHGFVGFDYLPKPAFTPDDLIECVVADTGQVLPGPNRIAK